MQARSELAQQVSSEQAAFLKRFQESLGGVFQASVAEAQKTVSQGLAPLLEQWKTMTDAHQQEIKRVYDRIGEQAEEQHKTRLESVSNQWLLATVSSLDHNSREMISGIAAAAEEKLRAACAQVFEGVGDALRQRLSEIAKNFTRQLRIDLRLFGIEFDAAERMNPAAIKAQPFPARDVFRILNTNRVERLKDRRDERTKDSETLFRSRRQTRVDQRNWNFSGARFSDEVRPHFRFDERDFLWPNGLESATHDRPEIERAVHDVDPVARALIREGEAGGRGRR